MNINFKLISRSNPSGSRSNSLESRSNLDYLSRILKLGTLGCALVLTTFNVGQATEDSDIIEDFDLNKTVCIDHLSYPHLQLAEQEFSKLKAIVNTKSPEDNMPILKNTNETLSVVSNTMQNLIINVDSQSKMFTPEIVLEQALEYCFSYLNDIKNQLNNAKDDPGIDYLTRESLEKQIKKCHLVYNQCLKIVCHLITYRSTK